ncbi:hypothetical protein [Rhodopirellula europaea]|uniref:hypothetical protein n=1 Tax=Rhodopirellula europaea TaxID=1263866 RepID=UPI003D2E672F
MNFTPWERFARNTDITLRSPLPDSVDSLTAIRFTGMPLDPEKAISDSEWGFVLSHVDAKLIPADGGEPTPIEFADVISDEPDPFHDPNGSLNEKSNHGFAAYTRIHYPRSAAFLLKEPLDVSEGSQIEFTIKHRVYMLSAFSLVTRRGHLAVSSDPEFQALLNDESLQAQRKELAELKSRRNKIESTTVPNFGRTGVAFGSPQPRLHSRFVFDEGQAGSTGHASILPAFVSRRPTATFGSRTLVGQR